MSDTVYEIIIKILFIYANEDVFIIEGIFTELVDDISVNDAIIVSDFCQAETLIPSIFFPMPTATTLKSYEITAGAGYGSI